MSKGLGWTIALCLLCFPALPASQAKPPDLPVEQGFACPEGRDEPGRGELFALELDQSEEARQAYQAGERCRRSGALQRARVCYEQAHLLSPTSLYGRLAMQRLFELEQPRDAAEEQEEPLPQRRLPTQDEPPLSKPPTTVVPLGLVERSY